MLKSNNGTLYISFSLYFTLSNAHFQEQLVFIHFPNWSYILEHIEMFHSLVLSIDVISGVTEKQPEHSQVFQCFLRPELATPRLTFGGGPPGGLTAPLSESLFQPGTKEMHPCSTFQCGIKQSTIPFPLVSLFGLRDCLIQYSGSAEWPV